MSVVLGRFSVVAWIKRVLRRLGAAHARLYWYKYQVLVRYKDAVLQNPQKLFYALRYLLLDKELSNFTYDIANVDELTRFLARGLGMQEHIVRAYAEELIHDEPLRYSLREKLRTRKDRNKEPRYGRRIGWYCLVRLRKPRLVVETGTQDGLGAAVLRRALARNRAEGYPGLLRTFDIDPSAGWLLDPEGDRDYEIIIGDTKETLAKVLEGERVDLFIHDSDHRYEHEMFELGTIRSHLSLGAILVSDNAHASTAFRDFCERYNIEFSFFREKPLRHFYRGAGIGLGLPLREHNIAHP